MTPASLAAQKSTAQRRPRRRRDLIQHELDGEALIFDPRSLNTHRLNETALLVWRQSDGTCELSEIASVLANTYDVDDQEASDHVVRLHAELDSLGLLEEETAPGRGVRP